MFGPRDIGNISKYKTCVGTVLGTAKCRSAQYSYRKHMYVPLSKKTFICMHSLLDMPSFSFNHRGTRITLRSAFGGVWRLCDDESAELVRFAVLNSEMFCHGCLLAVLRCSKQCESDVQGIPRRKGIPLLRVTDLRV